MATITTKTTFENVIEVYEEETRAYDTYSCIPFTKKYGSGQKVIVLVIGDKNATPATKHRRKK